MNDPAPQATVAAPPSSDPKHLDLIGLFYYLLAAFTGLFSLLPTIHVAIGVAMLSHRFPAGTNQQAPPPEFMGWMFVVMGSVFIIGGLTCAVLFAFAGRRIRERRNHTFCLVAAGVSCMFMPLGTVLGVFALVLLLKPDVKAAFASAP
ncbi:hypothetical protein [Lysobacter sp. CA199]|uniref:hypothetical protein n=1 Tax=Lysobacter sp. CA199 TaxID=3455608 RepID=UPI003F8D5A4C